jgi:hypothetical protein
MSAAEELIGLVLDNGWKVARRLAQAPSGTGGNFSHGYIVEKDGRVGFLKAFDFSKAFRPSVSDPAAIIQAMTTAYNYEREVLDHCGGKRLSKVVLAIDSGRVRVPGMGEMDGTVFYLIFERADNDVRVQMSEETACDALWCLRALRDVTLGLWQVHREMIAHQDAKPSNVLVYAGPTFKIADFGRSSRRGRPSPHDDIMIAGDPIYAPPELMYGFAHSDFMPRRVGCDLYMLGNLAVFLFTGLNVTAYLVSHLDPQHRPNNWGGSYEEVLPYLRNAFTKVLDGLQQHVDERVREDVITLVRELCHPDLGSRGHPKGLGRYNQYSLERYVPRLTNMVSKLSVRIRVERKAA